MAILKLAGKHITRKRLHHCFNQNPDGAGFMYATLERGLVIKKGYFSFKGFYKTFRKAESYNPKANFVVHFRLATSGNVNEELCHPFAVNKEYAFVHNGIFIDMDEKKHESDTQVFCRMLKKLPDDWFYNKAGRHFIQSYVIGQSSKLIILTNKGNYWIVNEKAGVWEDGIWYSNYGYINHNMGFGGTLYAGFGKEKYGTWIEDIELNKSWRNCSCCLETFQSNELQELADGQLICNDCVTEHYEVYKGQLIEEY